MDSPQPTLKQLHYLRAVAESGHFRKAADRCDVSQPSLSAQIQTLEETLGLRLLERSRAGVTLTPIGREVLDRARRVLDEIQGIMDVASSARHGLVGTIRLGAKPTLGPYLLPYVVARLHRQYPDLNLYIREGAPQSLTDELIKGGHDVILSQLPVRGAELVTEHIFGEPLYVALAADHPLALQSSVSTSDLAGLQIITLEPRYHLHDTVSGLCEEFGATMLRDYEGTSLDAVRQMVGMGMGASFLPALYVRSEITSRSEVVVKPLKGRRVVRSIGLVWRRSAGRAEAYRQIADVMRDVAAKRFKDLVLDG